MYIQVEEDIEVITREFLGGASSNEVFEHQFEKVNFGEVHRLGGGGLGAREAVPGGQFRLCSPLGVRQAGAHGLTVARFIIRKSEGSVSNLI